ncbi:hypothetical protein [Lysobacter panacisoli]|uniref:DUF1440 domain-containing protein n=1 Tax=Lysobacter panacisoli TaxID=1255263 RepID=A0ABP9L5V1_9GAMM|nr:hypothetical protein [Lysobacter panacisoli]
MKATVRTALSLPRERPATWVWLLLGGLAVGSLDLVFAIAWWAPSGTAPIRIPQSIASWVIGRDAAFAGGMTTALFGALLHYYVMTAIVAIYHVAARDNPVLRRRPLLMGALYGALWFTVIHVIAVPMFSAAPPRRFLLDWNLACLLVHMVAVGIPAALMARRWYGR